MFILYTVAPINHNPEACSLGKKNLSPGSFIKYMSLENWHNISGPTSLYCGIEAD